MTDRTPAEDAEVERATRVGVARLGGPGCGCAYCSMLRQLDRARAELATERANVDPQERVARAMYYRVMEETRDTWPFFQFLPEAAQENWRESARKALDGAA